MRKREVAAATALLLALLSLFFFRCTFTGDIFSPAELLKTVPPWIGVVHAGHPNALRNDDVFLAYPLYATHLHALRLGQIPLWDPWKLGGTLGGMAWVSLGQILYPPSWVLLSEPNGGMLIWFAKIRLLVGGLGMFFLLRRFKVSTGGALLGALAFMLNTVFVVWLSSPIPSVMVWLPWTILAFETILERPTLLAFSGLALSAGIQFLGGYIAESLVFAVTAGGYVAVRLVGAARGLGAAAMVRRLSVLALAGAGAVAVGALGIFPPVAALSGSPLAGRGAGASFLGVQNLATYLVPNFYGNPTIGTWWAGANFCELIAYVGLVPLFLGLLAVRRRGLRGALLPFTVLLVGLLGYQLGWPGLRELGHLPGFSQTAITRWNGAMVFVLAALAGFGWDEARESPSRTLRDWAVFVAIATLGLAVGFHDVWASETQFGLQRFVLSTAAQPLLIAGLATWIGVSAMRRGGFTWRHGAWAFALTVLDLGLIGADFNPTTPKDSFYPVTPGIARLQVDADQGRVLPLEGIFAGDMAGLFGLQSLAGYDIRGERDYHQYLYEAGDRLFSFEQNVTPNGYLLPTLGRGHSGPNELWLNIDPNSPLLDLMAVRHLVMPPTATSSTPLSFSYDGKDLKIVDNPHARPLSWWTSSARQVLDDRVYEELRRAPRGGPVEALLAEPLERGQTTGKGQGKLTTLFRGVSEWRMRLESTDPGFVMLSQRFHPGWKASIDDQPATLVRADAILSALPVPAGTHLISVKFAPPVSLGSFWASVAGLFGFSVLALAAALFRRRLPRDMVA